MVEHIQKTHLPGFPGYRCPQQQCSISSKIQLHGQRMVLSQYQVIPKHEVMYKSIFPALPLMPSMLLPPSWLKALSGSCHLLPGPPEGLQHCVHTGGGESGEVAEGP